MAVTRVGVEVRALRPDDLAWTGPLHRAALPHNFFARLGPRFLRAYERAFLESPFGIALAAEADGTPVGFLLGASDADHHRDWVLRRGRTRLALLGAACLAARPGELVRFVRTRAGRYARALAASRRGTRGYAGDPPPRAAVLTHVAVAPDRRRSGAGGTLVEAFVAEARRRGATRARLTTLHDDESAEGFWLGLGWEAREIATDDEGRRHRVFEREL